MGPSTSYGKITGASLVDDDIISLEEENELLYYDGVRSYKDGKLTCAADDLSKLTSGQLAKEQLNFERDFQKQKSAPRLAEAMKPLTTRDWTKEFLSILQRPALERGQALAALSQDFVRVARRIGERIVLEASLPYHEKTIRPPPDQKGRAGGLKFFHSGIFFKFAVDSFKIYGGDKFAMKACGLELTAMNALVSAGLMIGLNFPLCCIIDFLGHRLIAQSVLPINSSTLIYGSENRGGVIRTSNPKMNEIMKQLGKIHFIKGHIAGKGISASELYGPLDIEGHQGTDQLFYLCDMARYFPPECPELFPCVARKSSSTSSTGTRSQTCYLYRQLRPELLQAYSVPLSSDAYSPFGIHERHIHNAEVKQATHFLFSEIIPSLASKLDGVSSLAPFGYNPDAAELPNNGAVANLLHRHGINIRWMGLVYRYMRNQPIRLILLEEMIARVLKCEIRASLRTADDLDLANLRSLALSQFNQIFQGTPAVWLRIRDLLMLKFESALTSWEVENWFVLRSRLNMFRLFQVIQHHTGIHFHPSARDSLRNHFTNLRKDPHTASLPFHISHIKDLASTVKTMQILPRIEADSLYMHAETLTKTKPKEAINFYKLAIVRYDLAIRASPSDASALANWGNVLIGMGKIHYMEKRLSVSEVESFFLQAHEKFRQATEIQDNNISSFRSWIQALHLHLEYFGSHSPPPRVAVLYSTLDRLYGRLIFLTKSASTDQHATRNYFLAGFLGQWGCALLQQARFLRKTSTVGLPSPTPLLERVEAILLQAQENLEEAIRVDPDNTEAQVNLGVVLMDLATLVTDDDGDDSFFSRAFSIFTEVENSPNGRGKAAYNIACLYGILLNRLAQHQRARGSESPDSRYVEYENQCRKFLTDSFEAGTLPKTDRKSVV